MSVPPLPEHEADRLKALQSYDILDTEPEEAFDDLTRLASYICGVPIALVSLVDEHRQWFKSNIGLTEVSETHRDLAFCAYAVTQPDQTMIVSDTFQDERFAEHPLVEGDPNIRFYAGTPLVTPDGYALGTLCVIDREPRELNEEQVVALRTLGRQVMQRIELRRKTEQLEQTVVEQQKAEAALRFSEQRLEMATVNSNVGIWDWDIVNETLYWSPQLKADLGYADDELDIDFETFASLLHPDDTGTDEALQAHLTQNTPYDIEQRQRHKSGGYRWFRVQGQATFDENGKPLRMIGTSIDITERKQVEEALRVNEERLATATTNSGVFVWDWDMLADRLYWSPAFRSWLGYSEDELDLTYEGVTGLMHPDDSAATGKVVEAHLNDNAPYDIEQRILHKSGENLWIRSQGQAVYDDNGKPIRIIGTSVDITERKVAEAERERLLLETENALKEARETEDLLTTIIDATPDWIFVKDQDHRYQLVNQGYSNSLQIPKETFIGKNDLELGFPEDIVLGNEEKGIRGFWPDDDEIFATGQSKFIEIEPAEVEGQTVYLSTVKAPVYDEKGDVWGVLGYIRDITQREQVLQESEEQTRRLTLLNDLSQALSETTSEAEVRAVLADHVAKIIQGNRVSLTMITSEGNQLEVFALDGQKGVIPTGAKLSLAETLAGQAIQKRQVVIVPDITESHYVEMPKLRSENMVSIISAPLIVGDQILGTLNIASHQLDAYDERDERLLQQMASLIASMLENRRLFDEIQTTLEKLESRSRELRNQAQIIDSADILIGAADLEGNTIFLNRKGQKMLGFDQLSDVVGRPIIELTALSARDQLQQEILPQVFQNGNWRGESALQHSTGYEFPVEQSLFLVYDDQQEVQFIATSIFDITERKQAELALAKQAAELQTVTEVSTILASTLDEDKLLQQVVDLTKERFGLYHAHIYLLDETGESLHLTAGSGEAGRKMVTEDWNIPLDHKNSIVALTARKREGRIVNDVRATADFLANPLLPDTRSEMAIPVVAGTELLGVLDVQSDELDRFTEQDVRIQTSLALQVAAVLQNARQYQKTQQQTQRFEDVVSLASEFVWEVDLEGRYTYGSDSMFDILGYTSEELIGKTAYVHMTPEEAERTRPIFEEKLANQQSYSEIEVRFLAKEGHEITLLTSGLPVFDEQGGLKGYRGMTQDITERLQAEDALRISEERLALATANGRVGIWDWDIVNDTLYWSPQMKALAGYADDELEIDFEKFATMLHPDDTETQAAIDAHFNEGKPFIIEHLIRHKSGEYCWHLTQGETIFDDNGRPLRMIGTDTDINERKQIEEALRESQAEVEQLLEFSPEAIGVVNTQTGLFENVNAGSERLYGLPREELVKVGPAQMSPEFQPDGRPSAEKAGEKIKAALDGDRPVFEWVHRNAQGEDILCEIRLVGLTGSQNHLVRFSVTDIRERKKVEVERERLLAETETLYQMSRIFTEISDPREMSEAALAQYLEVVGVNQGGVMIYDEALTEGTLIAQMMNGAFVEPGLKIPVAGNPAVQKMIETKQPVAIDDALNDPLLEPIRELVLDLKYKSLLLVPILGHGQVIGVLGADSVEKKHHFTQRQIDFVQATAERFGLALANQNLFAQTEAARTQAEIQAQQLDVLYQMGQDLNEVESETEMFNVAASVVTQIFGSSRGSVALLDDTHNHFEILALKGNEAIPVGTQLPVENTMLGEVVKQRRTLVANDFEAAQWQNYFDLQGLAKQGLRSCMDVPLLVENRVIGTLNVASAQPHIYSTQDEILIGQIASLLASSIENRRLFTQTEAALEETEDYSQRLEQLYNLGRELSNVESEEAVFGLAAQMTAQIFEGDRGSVTLLNETGDKLEIFALKGNQAIPTGTILPLDKTSLNIAVRENRVLNIPDFTAKEWNHFAEVAALAKQGIRSSMNAPLVVQEKVIGTLNVASMQTYAYPSQYVNLIGSMASLIASTIENVRLLGQAQKRVERERLLREVTAKVRSSMDVDTILRTAAEEIGQVMGRPTTVVMGNGGKQMQKPQVAEESEGASG